MPEIKSVSGLEILDSRGRPTVQATCEFSSGVVATASVPSGASTGSAEALELRDGDPQRYRGLGCQKAIDNIHHVIRPTLAGKHFDSQNSLDQALLELDGTSNKSRLGANAILGVSLAFARAMAIEQQMPLYRYFATIVSGDEPLVLPRPIINLFSGGKHAGGQVAIQDVLIMPAAASRMRDIMAMAVEVFQSAAELVNSRYNLRLLTADEGGLAPPFERIDMMFEAAVEAIRRAGLCPGEDVVLALDVASTHFYKDRLYHLDGRSITSEGMIAVLKDWVERYEITCVEDGLAEDDWAHWKQLNAELGQQVMIVGDDLLCTNPERIRKAIENSAANTLLLKVNQIGTLTEAAEADKLARTAGWRVIISARSGETEDNWLADLAVGWRGDRIKIGSVTQSERLAKYNRLLAIEAETGFAVTV
jgi:enolase